MHPSDRFEVGNVTTQGIELCFAKSTTIIIPHNASGLKRFYDMFVTQKWSRVRLAVRSTSGDMVFDLIPNSNNSQLLFGVDGQLWNLSQEHVYRHIRSQMEKLVHFLEKQPSDTESRNRCRGETVLVCDYDHCLSILLACATGGKIFLNIGYAALAALLDELTKLDVRKAASVSIPVLGCLVVEKIVLGNHPTSKCITVKVTYCNGAGGGVAMSYDDVRMLAETCVTLDFISVKRDRFNMKEIHEIINDKYKDNCSVFHPDKVDVKLAEVFELLKKHPEYHALISDYIKEVQIKP